MKDILFDIESKDIAVTKATPDVTYHDVVWGDLFSVFPTTLYLNIVLDEEGAKEADFEQEAPIFYCKIPYTPKTQTFTARVVVKGANGKYAKKLEGTAVTLMGETRLASMVRPCQLPAVNIDGLFAFQFYKDHAYIFSADSTDCATGKSNDQEVQILGLNEKLGLFRYPMTGVGIHGYLNSIPVHTSLGQELLNQCQSDSKYVDEAEFDVTTGELNVTLLGDGDDDTNDTSNLTAVSALNTGSIEVEITRQNNSECLLVDLAEFGITDADGYLLTCIND